MTGYAAPIGTIWQSTYLPIAIRDDEVYNIDFHQFKSGATPAQLLAWTKQVLEAFDVLETAVNRNVAANKKRGLPLEQSLELSTAVCQKQLAELAQWGTLVYRRFFDDGARKILNQRFQPIRPGVPNPTFVSDRIPFPWEVLYEGDDYKDGDPERFWGLRYAPARILNEEDPALVRDQDSTSKMLFCMHHRLRESHQREWPVIEKLVKVTQKDYMYLLGPSDALVQISDGETLLERLDKGEENMVHFACHAARRDAGADALIVSLIELADFGDVTGRAFNPRVIELDTNAFTLRQGAFQSRPLIFLNACHSGGGSDELRETYNLPRMFIERGAGAVIATACPIPDIFAAEFARVFYSFFLRGRDPVDRDQEKSPAMPMTIGEALRRARWYFIKRYNNPLGLAYGLYSPAHYRVALAPANQAI